MPKNRLIFVVLFTLILSGCAAQKAYKEGQVYLEQGRIEEGLVLIEQANRLDPNNNEYRAQYYKQRELAIFQWLSLADIAKSRFSWDEAESYYKRILKVDIDNPRAKLGLSTLSEDKYRVQLLNDARAQLNRGETTDALKKIRSVLSISPSYKLALDLRREAEARLENEEPLEARLKSRLSNPITIEFKDAPIKTVFDSISKVAGINFIFDKEIRSDLRVNLIVRDTRIEDVIHFILVTNQLSERVLNANTLFIYPNTPDKLRDFQELQVKNFYLTNATAKDVASVVKGLIKPKEIYVDEKLNLIVMRDTPSSIRVAEKLVAAQDIAEPEVMLEVEVLEIGTNLLDNIGIQYPSQMSLSVVGSAGAAGSVTLPELRSGNSGLVRVSMSDPSIILNLLHQQGESNLLANPKIRVKSREKANVHIGDKVPVITNTTTATGLVSQNITYLDVGLKLDVEPTVYLDSDVGIKVALEVSNIVKQIQNANGSLTYQIGTRNASTVLRLKDGETQILAGLINKEDRRASNGIPGLGQLPLLGRLFSSRSDTASKTEVVLLITPHVIRNIVRPEFSNEEFLSGTASLISLEGLRLNSSVIADSKNMSGQNNAKAIVSPVIQMDKHSVSPPLGSAQLTFGVPDQISIGKPFTININVVANGLQNALLDIAFDPARLKVLNIFEGNVLNKLGERTQFIQQVQDKYGRINIGLTRAGNIQGEGQLASITFQALTSGDTQLRIGAANLSDSEGRLLPINTLPAVTVGISK